MLVVVKVGSKVAPWADATAERTVILQAVLTAAMMVVDSVSSTAGLSAHGMVVAWAVA